MLVGAGVVVLLIELVAIVRAVRSDDPGREPDPSAVSLPLLAPDPLPEEGALVLAEVREDGTVRVSQWVRSGDGIDQLTLAAPAVAGSAGPVRATGVRVVAADGTVVADELVIGTEPRRIRFADPTTMARATYVLRGAVDRSATEDGRLRALVSLDADLSSLSGPTVAVVKAQADGEVLGVGCGNARSAVQLVRPCGTPDGSGWRVRLPAVSREDRLTAVVDLP